MVTRYVSETSTHGKYDEIIADSRNLLNIQIIKGLFMDYDAIAKNYVRMLCEMAVPTPEISNMTFWHGTKNKQNADEILKNGIKVSDVVSRGSLVPVHGANYITPHIDYAAIYSIGGNVLGTKGAERDIENPKYGEHGYLFKIHGSSLKDVQPDEDSIGQLIHDRKGPGWLHNLANKHLSDKTMRDIKNGEYRVFARSGKTLVKKMTDHQKLDLIMNHGTHVAHFGVLHPDEAYEINRNDVKHIKRDASNIFDYAKRIK